jgi:hypothetical protein
MGFFHDNLPFSPPLEVTLFTIRSNLQETLSSPVLFIGLANQGKEGYCV